jgi:hypothetical protein
MRQLLSGEYSVKWTRAEWESEIETIRRWRSNVGCAAAYYETCAEEARSVLERYTEWDHATAMRVAVAWHPSKCLPENMPAGGVLEFPSDPTDGSGTAYSILEDHGGRLTALGKRAGWAAGNEARARFMIVSAALVLFEAEMLDETRGKRDPAAVWRALYWLARFNGNLERVRTDTMQRRKSGGKNRETKRMQASTNRKKVDAAFGRLMPTQKGSAAAALIAERTGLSPPTVRAHLVGLGLRQARIRK